MNIFWYRGYDEPKYKLYRHIGELYSWNVRRYVIEHLPVMVIPFYVPRSQGTNNEVLQIKDVISNEVENG
jgi:hypothetical protein